MYNILSVYLWVLIISPLSAISAMMITILSLVISVGLQTRLPRSLARPEANQQARTWKAGPQRFGFCPALQHPLLLWLTSPLAASPQTLQNQLYWLLCSACFPSLTPKGCLFNITSYPGYLWLLQDPIRMLWGLRFFPKESFPESKHYKGGQIISNYNLQKTGGLSQVKETGRRKLQKYLHEK